MIRPTMKLLGNLKRVDTGRVSIVQQHFADEVDINTIMRRFGVTGQMPNFLPDGMYGDFTGIEDYESAVAKIERADNAFMALPAEVRERFGNSAAALMRAAAVSDEDAFGKLVFPDVVPPAKPVEPAEPAG